MPSRWACVLILLAWSAAAIGLFRRDILPDFLIGPPPDLRSVVAAERDAGPTSWSIQVADERSPRSVGKAVTRSKRSEDGSLRLEATVWIESDELLKGTPFAHRGSGRLQVENACEVDPSGNLRTLRVVLRADGAETPLLTLDGVYKDHAIEIRATSPVPMLEFAKQPIPYEPKSMIQNALGPIDRLPGLAVGQRWEERVVSPLTGRVEVVRAEVVRRSEIFWGAGMVGTLEVMHKGPPGISARTWVRKSDGLVLRQEIPLPLVKLLIERTP